MLKIATSHILETARRRARRPDLVGRVDGARWQPLDRGSHVPANEFDHLVDIDPPCHVPDEEHEGANTDEGEQDADTKGERGGTNSPSLWVRTLLSTISAYEKVPRKAPRVN